MVSVITRLQSLGLTSRGSGVDNIRPAAHSLTKQGRRVLQLQRHRPVRLPPGWSRLPRRPRTRLRAGSARRSTGTCGSPSRRRLTQRPDRAVTFLGYQAAHHLVPPVRKRNFGHLVSKQHYSLSPFRTGERAHSRLAAIANEAQGGKRWMSMPVHGTSCGTSPMPVPCDAFTAIPSPAAAPPAS